MGVFGLFYLAIDCRVTMNPPKNPRKDTPRKYTELSESERIKLKELVVWWITL